MVEIKSNTEQAYAKFLSQTREEIPDLAEVYNNLSKITDEMIEQKTSKVINELNTLLLDKDDSENTIINELKNLLCLKREQLDILMRAKGLVNEAIKAKPQLKQDYGIIRTLYQILNRVFPNNAFFKEEIKRMKAEDKLIQLEKALAQTSSP